MYFNINNNNIFPNIYIIGTMYLLIIKCVKKYLYSNIPIYIDIHEISIKSIPFGYIPLSFKYDKVFKYALHKIYALIYNIGRCL